MKKYLCRMVFAFGMAAWASASMGGAVEYKDPLDVAVAPLDDVAALQRTNRLILYAGDTFSYDNNIYRLPASVTDLATLPGIGRNPSREDSIESVTGGLDGEWLTGARQSVDVNLRADYNRYIRNTDLNDVSSNDRVAWNWGLGTALSGKVGADYTRVLGGFYNTAVYTRDIVNRSDYFASLRYQLGPRWGIFGGLMGSDYRVTPSQATFNNSKSKSVDVGADYTIEMNRLGFDYRYNDSRASNTSLVNGVLFNPDYREDRARVLARYALTEKTIFDASAGYLKRDYPSSAIGSFSGEIWRAALQWQPTPKTQLLVGAWQQLDADLTSQTDYFKDRGVSLTPEWIASEKLTFSATISRDTNSYLGSNPAGSFPVVTTQARHDTLTGETGSLVYTPIRAIVLTFSAAHVKRDSNIPQFQFNDFQGSANITYRFFRYGDNQ
ncbi:MAG TPA: outer membrane beta-barrel protein [Steroidobacteraceae bacterium]|nr:outer membrane beta-barrel protein [Steroidobacteraceae bacterium]